MKGGGAGDKVGGALGMHEIRKKDGQAEERGEFSVGGRSVFCPSKETPGEKHSKHA